MLLSSEIKKYLDTLGIPTVKQNILDFMQPPKPKALYIGASIYKLNLSIVQALY